MIERVGRVRANMIGSEWLRRIALIGIMLAALWIAIPALGRMAALLTYSYPHDGLEGTLLYEARLLRAGEPLYRPLELYRFVSAPYPPIHYLFLALFDLIPGPHIFWAGRLLSMIAGFGVALFAALIVRRTGAAWPIAAFAAALVLSIPPLQLWSTRIKPDMLALLFTSIGLYCTTIAYTVTQRTTELQNQEPRTKNHRTAELQNQEPGTTERQNHRTASRQTQSIWLAINVHPMLILAAIAFVLAFFTKQTAVGGPLAAGLALLIGDLRDRQYGAVVSFGPLRLSWRTILFTGLYLGLVLIIWGLLDLATARQYTLHVWWDGKRTEWWTFLLFSKIIVLLGFWWPQMILAALALLFSWKQRSLLVPACYMLVVPLTLLGTGEQGANHNHLLETHLALAIAGCAALGVLIAAGKPNADISKSTISRPNESGTHRTGSSQISVLAVLLGCLIAGAQVYQANNPPDWYAGELDPQDPPERFLNFIRNTPGEILADDTGLLFQAGRDLRYDDPSTMGPAARIGAWDQRGLLEEIAQQKFSAIILPVNVEKSIIDPAGRWTPEMLAAIQAHYKLKFRDTLYIYVPRER